jgi:hypothetical protein
MMEIDSALKIGKIVFGELSVEEGDCLIFV